MKLHKTILFALVLLLLTPSTILLAQDKEKEKTVEQMAAEEAERLEKQLKLEPHQTFYVDSILQHDMNAMKTEMEEMKRSGMQEASSYRAVQEKWRKQIEVAYEKFFTPEQWQAYLKMTGQSKKRRK